MIRSSSEEAPARWPAAFPISGLLAPCLVALLGSCSVERYAIDKLGDALAGNGAAFASDDDPELVREAVPFSLKLVESVLAESPRHAGLLLAATRGFTQYAYGFLQQDADRLEDLDLAAAEELRARARKLFWRARDYGLRGLELEHPSLAGELRARGKAGLAQTGRSDVPFLYWTAAAWGAGIALSKDQPEVLADQPLVEALIDRALALDPSFERGAIHAFLIAYEPSRPGGARDWEARSRAHFERALELGQGRLAAPYVTYAETVTIQKQERREFERLLGVALAIDPDAEPGSRLENLIVQRRARWLLSKTEDLFVE